MGQKKTKLSRREFLRSNAAYAMTLPFLPTLFSFEADAGETVRPRFISIYSCNGQRQEYWDPKAAANVSFGTGLERAMGGFSSTGLSQILGTPFSPYLSKMTMIQGMDQVISMGHNNQALLGHFDSSKPVPTIDQVLAKSSKFYGGTTPIIDCLSYGTSFSYGYSGTTFASIPTFNEIGGSYERVFGLGQPAVLLKHSKIIEKTLGIYNRMAASTKISSIDKAVLNTQANIVSDLRNRLQTMQALNCVIPAKPSGAGNEGFFTDCVDMIVASFLCGATQVANIGITDPTPVDSPNGWHGSSHTPEPSIGAAPNSLVVNKWIAEKFFLRLIQKMDSIVEANGKTMLDNSLIYWGNELSTGNGHASDNMPIILAGSAGGKIRAGYVYDYRQLDKPAVGVDNAGSTNYMGRPYNQFLVTVLQSMGLAPADYERNGNSSYGLYLSSNADRNARYTAMIADVGKPLQKIFV